MSETQKLSEERIAELEAQLAEKNAELAEQQKTIEGLQETVSQQSKRITELTGEEPVNVANFVDQEKDPELFQLVSDLVKMDKEERSKELEKIFTKIPKFRGVRIEKISARDFLEKHWRFWISLGFAVREDVARFSGEALPKRLNLELNTEGLQQGDFLPSQKTISNRAMPLITDEVERAVWRLQNKRYKSNKK